MRKYTKFFDEISLKDTESFGGKNASLGEMITALGGTGINVPQGFCTSAGAYRFFLRQNELEMRIKKELQRLNSSNLSDTAGAIRRLIFDASFPPELRDDITDAYQALKGGSAKAELGVAVRSSATMEDLPEASFAGQQDSFLNINGEEALLEACKRCYASLFNDRAIAYRTKFGFDHMKAALSVGVQRMIRADKASAGVLFTLDTESGFRDVVVINSAWGLGESVVSGKVEPDEYVVFKPLERSSAGTATDKFFHLTMRWRSTIY